MTMTIGAPAAIRVLGRDVGAVLRLVVVAQEPVGRVAPVRLVDDPAVGVAEDVDRRRRRRCAGCRARSRRRGPAPSTRRWPRTSPGARLPAMPTRYDPAEVDDGVAAGHRSRGWPPSEPGRRRRPARRWRRDPMPSTDRGRRRRPGRRARAGCATIAPPMNPAAPVTKTLRLTVDERASAVSRPASPARSPRARS